MKRIFIIILLFTSCKSKQITHTITQYDTIQTTKVVKITPPGLNEIIIDNPCDSLGRLKNINVVSSTGKVRTSLKSDGNSLKLQVNIDSIVDVLEKQYKSSNKTEYKEVITTKYKNKKLMWYSLGFNLLLLAWILRKPILRAIKPI